MVRAMRVKSPFYQSALFGLAAGLARGGCETERSAVLWVVTAIVVMPAVSSLCARPADWAASVDTLGGAGIRRISAAARLGYPTVSTTHGPGATTRPRAALQNGV
jgi:hypothetical protein